MDHLPLPRDPVRSPPKIRYYCLEEYDKGDFNTYPERQGWTQEELFTSSTWTEVDGVSGRGRRAVAAFLQQWLFFGLLHAAFGDDIVFRDYIDEDGDKEYIHTRNLLAHADGLLSKRESGLVTENNMLRLDQSLKTAYLTYDFIRAAPVPALDPYFLLSLSLLGQFLTDLEETFSGNIDLPWSPPSIDYRTDFLQHEMIEQGWCPRAINKSPLLFGLKYRYFTSFLRNLEDGRRNHAVCTETQCLASQIQKSSYQTVHSSNGCGCHFQGFNQAAVEKVLEAGELPLVTWDRSNEAVNLISGSFDTTYVAISHVWSDGLGNPNANAMPQCQLGILNDLVQSLYPGKADQIPFWIDTLCCPAISSNGKQIAIRKMRDTYACANKVLALDTSLRSVDVRGRSVPELAFYIHSSNWSSRLWTFQEGALPQTLIFQFANATLNPNKILYKARKSPSNFTNGWGNASDLSTIHARIRGVYRRSEQPYRSPVMTLGVCVDALATRTTSVQEDESLCLASLMGIDPASLLDVARHDRMMRFWGQLTHVSEQLMYYEHSRLDFVGFRWAPKTLLGTGIDHMYRDARALPTKDGLLVDAYSITLSSLEFPLSHSIGGKAWIRGTDDHWEYYIAKVSHDYEHYTVLEGRFSRIALLMTSRISTSSVIKNTDFVMVFVTEEHDEVTYARRADAGMIFAANHSARQTDRFHTSQLVRREHMLGAKSDRVTREGKNYLIDNEYAAVVGDWTDEKSKWCID